MKQRSREAEKESRQRRQKVRKSVRKSESLKVRKAEKAERAERAVTRSVYTFASHSLIVICNKIIREKGKLTLERSI